MAVPDTSPGTSTSKGRRNARISTVVGGVIGVLPGIVGSIQAAEAIKLVLGVGETLAGRLLLFDALAMRFREVKVRRAGDCPLCGDAATQHELVEYVDACLPVDSGELEVDAFELARRLASPAPPALLDVRLPHELRIASLSGAIAIPLHELPARLGELPRDRPIVALCHVGVRSLAAVELLREAGFPAPRSLAGGIEAWSREIDPAVPRY
jgi:adenylyltransferase/sulfurtransferase